MSSQALIDVVKRSINDVAFRRQLAADAATALRGYDLTDEEIAALHSRDLAKLTAFGVDQRMSRIFTLDPGMAGSATFLGGEPRDIAPVWIGETTVERLSAQSPDAVERNAVFAADDVLTSGGVQSPDAAERNLGTLAGGASVEPRDVEPTWIGEYQGDVEHTFSGDDNPGPQPESSTGDGDLQQ